MYKRIIDWRVWYIVWKVFSPFNESINVLTLLQCSFYIFKYWIHYYRRLSAYFAFETCIIYSSERFLLWYVFCDNFIINLLRCTVNYSLAFKLLMLLNLFFFYAIWLIDDFLVEIIQRRSSWLCLYLLYNCLFLRWGNFR